MQSMYDGTQFELARAQQQLNDSPSHVSYPQLPPSLPAWLNQRVASSLAAVGGG